MSYSIQTHREGSHGTTQSTSARPEATGPTFPNLPHYDLLTCLAILQTFPQVSILDFTPKYDTSNAHYGASGVVHQSSFGGLVYKRFSVTLDVPIQAAYRAFFGELMVLEHPAFRRHPNIPSLKGVIFDVHIHKGSFLHILSVLVFRRSEYGLSQTSWHKM